MLRLYATSIREATEADLAHYLPLLSEARQQKILRYHFPKDQLRSLYGELLLRHAIQEALPTGEALRGPLHFAYEEHGKPYLPEHPELHVSISHSGDMVSAAVSDCPVGIDIEELREPRLRLARKFFTPGEYERIAAAPEGEQGYLFTDFWVAKESHIKCTGRGLGQGLSTFEIELGTDGSCRLHAPKEAARRYQMKLWHTANGCAAVCVERSTPITEELELIPWGALGDAPLVLHKEVPIQ